MSAADSHYHIARWLSATGGLATRPERYDVGWQAKMAADAATGGMHRRFRILVDDADCAVCANVRNPELWP